MHTQSKNEKGEKGMMKAFWLKNKGQIILILGIGTVIVLVLLEGNWQVVSTLIVAIVGLWKYFDTRNRELAWRRTEFLFEQAKLLDTDNVFVEVMKIMENRHPNISVKTLYENFDQKKELQEYWGYYQKFDKLLNFLDRIAYAYFNAKTLSIEEVLSFGWYLDKISENSYLLKYCKENGFNDILELSKEIDEYNKKLTKK